MTPLVVRLRPLPTKKILGSSLPGRGRGLYRAARAEVGAAYADDYQRLERLRIFVRGGDYALELALFMRMGRSIQPVTRHQGRSSPRHPVGRGRGGVIGAGGVKKRGGSGEIDFNHVSHPFT